MTPPSQIMTPQSDPPPLDRRHVELSSDDDSGEDSVENDSRFDINQKRNDNNLVRRPVLKFFDAKFLAPRFSKLFRRELRKAPLADGTFIRKRNEDIQLKLFKRLVRKVLRRIIGRMGIRVGTDKYLEMKSRLYAAALRVVKKRRANHIQSWRLYKKNKPLIYGGELGPNYHHQTGRHGRTTQRMTQRRQQRARSRSNDIGPDVDRTDVQIASISRVDDDDVDSDATMKYGSGDENRFEEMSVEFGDDDDTVIDRPNVAPPVTMYMRTKKCIDCGKIVNYRSAFSSVCPRDKTVRCEQCWDVKINDQVVPVLGERVERGGPEVPGNNYKKQSDEERVGDKSNPKKRRRVVRTSCRCGSTTHKTTRSKHCPLNKKNMTTTEPIQTTTTTPIQTTNTDPTQTNTEFDHKVGDNVLAKTNGGYFLAQVVKVNCDKCQVYFPEDSCEKAVPRKNIKSVPSTCTYPTRSSMIGEVWNFEGDEDLSPGRWRIRQRLANVYKCIRLSGGGPGEPTVEDFDIGYVIRSWMKEQQRLHESGAVRTVGKLRKTGTR